MTAECEYLTPPYPTGVTLINNKPNNKTGELVTRLHINPNKRAYIDDKYIDDMKTFKKVMKYLSNELNLKNEFIITRIDFRIDNYYDNYEEFYKINKIIVLLLGDILNLGNRWLSIEPMSTTPKTIRVQDAHNYQVEYYDRWKKTNRKGLARARLELRNKELNLRVKDVPELINQWRSVLFELPKYYEQLQEKQNELLMGQWQKIHDNGVNITIAEFIKQNKDNIYTIDQLKKIFKKIGVKNAEQLARQYSYRYNIEFVTNNNLKSYLRQIRKALIDFRG